MRLCLIVMFLFQFFVFGSSCIVFQNNIIAFDNPIVLQFKLDLFRSISKTNLGQN